MDIEKESVYLEQKLLVHCNPEQIKMLNTAMLVLYDNFDFEKHLVGLLKYFISLTAVTSIKTVVLIG